MTFPPQIELNPLIVTFPTTPIDASIWRSLEYGVLVRVFMTVLAMSPARMMQSRVFRVLDYLQMIWVHAVLILAKMMKLPPFRSGPIKNGPDNTMGTIISMLVSESVQPITILADQARPQPTARIGLNENTFSYALRKSAKLTTVHAGPQCGRKAALGSITLC